MSTLALLKQKIPLNVAELELSRVVSRIVETINPLEIHVFGSAARGELSDQSDIDLLIVLNSEDEIRNARKEIAKIRPFSDFPLDLVWMSKATFARKSETGGLAQVVQEEGKLLFRSRAND